MAGTVVIGADHGGFKLKELLKEWLSGKGYEVVDVGTSEVGSGSDYPDFANALAEYIGRNRAAFGALICRTGTGMTIAANRHRHIRAALLYSTVAARLAREHSNANVAVLGSDAFSDDENIGFLNEFLVTKFTDEERHARRIEKIS